MNKELLKEAKEALDKMRKEAFTPLTPEAQAAAASPAPPMDPAMMGMDPAMMGGAPMPPMDPAMMGGAPMPPMDPAMMGMDPAMMGMDPAMMGMDPSMAGGMPPMDPATGMPMPPMDPMDPATGMPMAEPPAPAGQEPGTVTLNMEDLKALIADAVTAAKGDTEAPEESKGSVEDRLNTIEMMLEGLVGATGGPPAAELGATEEIPPEALAETALPGGVAPQAGPEDLAAMMEMPMGGVSPEMMSPVPPAPPMPMQVEASDRKDSMLNLIKELTKNA